MSKKTYKVVETVEHAYFVGAVNEADAEYVLEKAQESIGAGPGCGGMRRVIKIVTTLADEQPPEGESA